MQQSVDIERPLQEPEGTPASTLEIPWKISNQTVLIVTTILFSGFVIAEIIGALVKIHSTNSQKVYSHPYFYLGK
jgi:pyrimidine operon attenuation protein/uracil phosphoribosyltransferase